jgi:hypothetical protein
LVAERGEDTDAAAAGLVEVAGREDPLAEQPQEVAVDIGTDSFEEVERERRPGRLVAVDDAKAWVEAERAEGEARLLLGQGVEQRFLLQMVAAGRPTPLATGVSGSGRSLYPQTLGR